MIKGKSPYPFETIALAVAFSPRLEALISETKRLAGLFGARTVFIHAGKKTPDKERLFGKCLETYGYDDSNCLVHWQDGNPVDTILTVCKEHVVDLLLIGALEKEDLLKYYMGSVSREISRRSKCSVMMITEPQMTPHPFSKIVVNGHDHVKTTHTLNTALYFARHVGADEIFIIDEPRMPMSMAAEAYTEESFAVQVKNNVAEGIKSSLVTRVGNYEEVKDNIKIQSVAGIAGLTVGQQAQRAGADLLVVNSPDHHLAIFDRVFSHDLEYVLTDLPCSMLIVHSRVF